MKRFGGVTIAYPDRLDVEAVKKLLADEGTNPTIQKLIFVETRKGPKVGRKLFPCYPMSLNEESGSLYVTVVQCGLAERYMTAVVRLPIEDMNVVYRLWALPPDEEMLDADPLKPMEKEEETGGKDGSEPDI